MFFLIFIVLFAIAITFYRSLQDRYRKLEEAFRALVIKHKLLDGRLDTVEKELAQLKNKPLATSPLPKTELISEIFEAAPITSTPLEAPEMAPVVKTEAPLPFTPPPQETITPQEIPIVPTPVQPEPVPSPVAAHPEKKSEGWESFVGGKLFNRIGAVALILFAVYFLKYAFENNLISETMRIVLGIFAGAGLIAGAELSRKSGYNIFAQGILSAGIAIEYLSVYVGTGLYHLVSVEAGFAGMCLVSLVALLFSYRLNSLPAVILAWAGGFATPFLLPIHTDYPMAMFIYLLVLNASLLFVIRLKPHWFILEAIGFIATTICYIAWYALSPDLNKISIFTSFAILAWCLFHLMDLIRPEPDDEMAQYLRNTVQVCVGVAVLLISIGLLHSHYKWELMTIIGSISGCYILSGWFQFRQNGFNNIQWNRLSITALAFLAVAALLAPTLLWSCILLFLLNVGLLAGQLMKRSWNAAELVGIIFSSFSVFLLYHSTLPLLDRNLFLVFIAAIWLLYHLNDLFRKTAFDLSLRPLRFAAQCVTTYFIFASPAVVLYTGHPTLLAVIYLLVAAGYAISAGNWWYRTANLDLQWNRLVGSAIVMLMAGTLVYFEGFVVVVFWSIEAILIAWWGAYKGYQIIGKFSFAMIAITFLKYLSITGALSWHPILEFELLFNLRFLAAFLLVGAMSTILFLATTLDEFLSQILKLLLGIGIAALVFLLITSETVDNYNQQIAMLSGRIESDRLAVASMQNMKQLVLSGAWLAYSVIAMVLGLWMRKRGIRLAAIIVFGMTIFKIFAIDLSFLDAWYRMLSFLALGVILISVSFLYQKYKAVILPPEKEGVEQDLN